MPVLYTQFIRVVCNHTLIRIHQNKELNKSQARRGGTLKGKLIELSNIYSIDVFYNIVMV